MTAASGGGGRGGGGEGEGDGLLPPFGEPPGPRTDDGAVLAAFVEGGPAGHSGRFHVEEAALVAGGDVAVALRLGHGAVLVRLDLPDARAGVQPEVERALAAAGMERLDRDTLLGVPVALQLLGLRLSSWDLWGHDIDAAFAALRAIAVGDRGGVGSPPRDALDQ